MELATDKEIRVAEPTSDTAEWALPSVTLRKGAKEGVVGSITLSPPGGGSWTITALTLTLRTVAYRKNAATAKWDEVPVGEANVTSSLAQLPTPKISPSKPWTIPGDTTLAFDVPRRAFAPAMLATYSSDKLRVRHSLELSISAGMHSFMTRDLSVHRPFALHILERSSTMPGSVAQEQRAVADVAWEGGGKAHFELLTGRQETLALDSGGEIRGKLVLAPGSSRRIESATLMVVQTEACKGGVVKQPASATAGKSSSSSSSSSSSTTSSTSSSSTSASSSAAEVSSTARCLETVCWTRPEGTAPAPAKPTDPITIDVCVPLGNADGEEAASGLRASLPAVKSPTAGTASLSVLHSVELTVRLVGAAEPLVLSLPLLVGHAKPPAGVVPRGSLSSELTDGASTCHAGDDSGALEQSTKSILSFSGFLLSALALSWAYGSFVRPLM